MLNAIKYITGEQEESLMCKVISVYNRSTRNKEWRA